MIRGVDGPPSLVDFPLSGLDGLLTFLELAT
jgi:hypothetical protein